MAGSFLFVAWKTFSFIEKEVLIMYKPSDVEIINQLCTIDTCLREAKKAVDNLHGNIPKIIYPAMKTLLDNVKTLLKRKNELRVMLWKEYGIFYLSDV